jgi:hypothetical protein
VEVSKHCIQCCAGNVNPRCPALGSTSASVSGHPTVNPSMDRSVLFHPRVGRPSGETLYISYIYELYITSRTVVTSIK